MKNKLRCFGLFIFILALSLTACGSARTLADSSVGTKETFPPTSVTSQREEPSTPKEAETIVSSLDFTVQELKGINEFLSRSNNRIPGMFLMCNYDKPENINYNKVFYNGTSSTGVPGPEETVTQEEKEAVAKAIGKEGYLELGLPVQKRPKAKVEALIKQYTSLSDQAIAGIEFAFPYVAEFDAYYSFYGDGEPISPKVKTALWLDEAHTRAQVEWEDSQRALSGTAVMEKSSEGWHFVSNLLNP